jgi:putative salt-induced outer membrane protein YdiY
MRSIAAAFILCLALPAFADDAKYEYKDPAGAPTPPQPTTGHISWKANMTFGLVYVAGNAESLGLSGTGLVSARRYHNEFTLTGGGAYVLSGVSKYGTGGPITSDQISAENWFVKGRYDRYFLDKNTVYVSFQSSGDRPAGFIYRLEPQVGYARLFWKSSHQLLRGEIGYDYTYEHRVIQPMGADRNIDYHSGRLFGYYENKFTQWASFSEGLELLEAFNHLDGFRLNSITSLSSTIYKNIALKLNFTLHFNNDPALRPAPTALDMTTGLPLELPPDDLHFQKVDTQLDLVVAVTFL